MKTLMHLKIDASDIGLEGVDGDRDSGCAVLELQRLETQSLVLQCTMASLED